VTFSITRSASFKSILKYSRKINLRTKQIQQIIGGIIMLMYFMNFLEIILLKVREEDGQGMVEYALLVGLIAVVVIGVLVLLGPAIAAKFTEIIDAL